MKDISIKDIRNLSISNLYEKLLINKELSYSEQLKILKIAIILINSEDLNVKRLGYRIIVVFSIRYENYTPLYEIAINQGLYPISHFIDSNLISEDRKNFFTEFNDSYSTIFKKGDIFQSKEQYDLYNFYKDNIDRSVSVVAPTSYGKTDLILDTIRLNRTKNICVITPTKSLLAQTRKRILSAKIDGVSKVVINPEMFNPNESSCLAVLTQERLLRLLKEAPQYFFDYVIVDEAHNILSDERRSELLAAVIMILNKRNRHTSFKFLTPFINDIENLKVKYTSYDLVPYVIKEYIKTEKIYVYDIKNGSGLHFYDQFLDEWYDCTDTSNNLNDIEFLMNFSGEKNIVYFCKPKDIELFAKKVLSCLPDIKQSDELEMAIKHISEYVNPEYTLIKCIRKGFIYHHGSIPDGIRQYIEYLYSTIKEIRFVLTSSTLLEGVNLPAEKMFLFDNRKGKGNLSSSNFKNLIGRVSRFSEVFNKKNTSLKGLTPEIYLVFGDYYMKKSNYKTFIQKVMKVDKKIDEKNENVLLIKGDNTKEFSDKHLVQIEEFIENHEKGTISNYKNRILKTEIGRICILNNIIELDLFDREDDLQSEIDRLRNQHIKISDCESLLNFFNDVFVQFIDNNKEGNLTRFKNEQTRKYYTMLLKIRLSNESFSWTVKKTVNYWHSLIKESKDTMVFVGRWGDSTRGGYNKYWTDISTKNDSEKINLAIVRIKEEQDFIDNDVMKFVEVFHDVDLVDESFYKKLKYGTDNFRQIVLIKNGFSSSLSKLLMEKYNDYVFVDDNSDIVTIDPEVIQLMSNNKENSILIFETKNNIFNN